MTSSERRQHPRHSCQFLAELYVLFPEETFRPHPFMVQVCDYSHAGLKVQCQNLDEARYKQLIANVRFARIVVRHEARIARVYCRVCWISTLAQEDGNTQYEFGLAYDLREKTQPGDIEFIIKRGEETRIGAGAPSEPLVEES